MKKIKISDKKFQVSLPATQISTAVEKVAQRINTELADDDIMFLCILNGSFMFAADLLKNITLPCQISFIRLASYSGTSSTGSVKQIMGLQESIENKTVIIIEDIVDTGNTIEKLAQLLPGYRPAKIKIASLLLKPGVYNKSIPIDYVGIEIPNDFIVGYGLDYNGFGRNYPDIYTVIE